MVVVVPAFSIGQQGEQPVVPTVFTRFVISVTPHVCSGIDRPSDVPGIDRSHDHGPEKELGSKPRYVFWSKYKREAESNAE